MNASLRFLLAVGAAGLTQAGTARATNPLILDQFTADPTARVFEGRIYVYPSHDIPPQPGCRPNWFCMEDYHVFSSANLTDWTDHGVILRQTDVPWADPAAYAMWAPDCVFKNGTYYFFFPARDRTGVFRIGVARSPRPGGPFRPEARPIDGVFGIDPGVFIDRDGSAYLFFAKHRIFVAKLRDDWLQIDGPVRDVGNLPKQGLTEGPFVFERKGIYYLTYPHVAATRERLEYATAAHPLGPYRPAGVIMDELPSGCWTNHQSVVEYQGQWYLFYHDNQLSPNFDKNRSMRADRLSFNDDGTIRKVEPTLRGVGIVDAGSRIQIDRASAISLKGVRVSFLDPADPRAGWKIRLAGRDARVRFNDVDFGQAARTSVVARAVARKGGAVAIRVDRDDGPVLGRVEIAPGREWTIVRAPAANIPAGVHDLFVVQAGDSPVELDWISFE